MKTDEIIIAAAILWFLSREQAPCTCQHVGMPGGDEGASEEYGILPSEQDEVVEAAAAEGDTIEMDLGVSTDEFTIEMGFGARE